MRHTAALPAVAPVLLLLLLVLLLLVLLLLVLLLLLLMLWSLLGTNNGPSPNAERGIGHR